MKLPKKKKIRVTKKRLDRGGYDSSGRYYGTGAPLYVAELDDDDVEFRASDRHHAKLIAERLAGATEAQKRRFLSHGKWEL